MVEIFLCHSGPILSYIGKIATDSSFDVKANCTEQFLGDSGKFEFIKTQISGADPGGPPGARASPLTLGFEAPKLIIFGPYLIFP